MLKTRSAPAPRSLQEWMERTRSNGQRLRAVVKAETGRDISATMLSFILRGSRRCSMQNALALHAVTGIPIKTLTQWPQISELDKLSGKRSNHAA